VREGEVEHQPVDLFGGHPRANLAREHVEAFGHQPARLAHAFERGGAVELDLSGFALGRERRVDVTHQGNRGRAASLRLTRCRCCIAM